MHKRRGRAAHKLVFAHNEFGTYDDAKHRGPQLCSAWCSGQDVAQAISAYMQLPMATSVSEACGILRNAHTLSLHYVLADTGGNIVQQQAGVVPRRTLGWSGLYPKQAESSVSPWCGYYRDTSMPQTGPVDDMVLSANQAGIAGDGCVLSNLAQPDYRRARMYALLAQSRQHDVASMARVQKDVCSMQALRLRPFFINALPDGPVRRCLVDWDACYDAESFGAHAFSLCYNAALRALAPQLGGRAWLELLAKTEISVWWCNALDHYLADPQTWHMGAPMSWLLCGALKSVASIPPEPWGRVQQLSAPHMLFGNGPIIARPARALPGSIATISQGNVVAAGAQRIAVGPAFRMICDLGEDAMYCALPGGIDDRPLHQSYASWLGDYVSGTYYRLTPPAAEEPRCMP
jgi:penicillin amidase